MLVIMLTEVLPKLVFYKYAYGLGIAATVFPFIRLLVWVSFPLAYPLSKLLDKILGHKHPVLFSRANFDVLFDLLGEAGMEGDLTDEEGKFILGALKRTKKTAADAMKPISEVFSINIAAKFDKSLIELIAQKGYSRVPVYCGEHTNIIGVILVVDLIKALNSSNEEDETFVRDVLRPKILRVPETMPLYDLLHTFGKDNKEGNMAVVVKPATSLQVEEKIAGIITRKDVHEHLLPKRDDKTGPSTENISIEVHDSASDAYSVESTIGNKKLS